MRSLSRRNRHSEAKARKAQIKGLVEVRNNPEQEKRQAVMDSAEESAGTDERGSYRRKD